MPSDSDNVSPEYSLVQRVLTSEFSIVSDTHAIHLLEQENATGIEGLLVQFFDLPGATHDWLQQWEVDYFTNGVCELTGISPALPSTGSRETFTPTQLAMAIAVMKFSLVFYKGREEEVSEKKPDAVWQLLTELQCWPFANKPLMTANQLTNIGNYLSKIFCNSFVRQLLNRPLCEKPYRLVWKINRPLVLRDVSPEPPPPKPDRRPTKAKPKKRGKKGVPPPPEDPTMEVGVQCRAPGLMPLRLAAPLPLMYELYTGEEYNEEELKKNKKGKKK